MVFTKWNKFRSFTEKTKYSVYFMLFWEKLYQNPVHFFSVIPRGLPLPHRNVLQYYIKRVKFEVNDVIFPSGCEARAINLANKNMKIDIFTCATSVRSKNIFTDVSRYPTRKHKMTSIISCFPVGYREIAVKIFFDLTLVRPVKIPIFMFLLSRLIARVSQPDGNMTSFTLYFLRLT